jgi:hypothetical protein
MIAFSKAGGGLVAGCLDRKATKSKREKEKKKSQKQGPKKLEQLRVGYRMQGK